MMREGRLGWEDPVASRVARLEEERGRVGGKGDEAGRRRETRHWWRRFGRDEGSREFCFSFSLWMDGGMWGWRARWIDGWICATSSIRGTNVSTNRNQAHAIVFFFLFFF